MNFPSLLVGVLSVLFASLGTRAAESPGGAPHRYLYVAEPGIRDYVEFGGHGLLVFDIDHDHRFVKRIPLSGLDEKGKPLNVKGVCANGGTKRIYVSTTKTLTCLDLITEKILWEKSYEGGCDRMAMSPDGKIIYLPSLESDHWHVLDAADGAIITKVIPRSGSHNTVYGLDGRHAYLAGLKSPFLTVTDTKDHSVSRRIGPFGASIRPFTINGSQTLCFVNVNELLGFEIGDLKTGQKLYRVEVSGFKQGPTKRHGCPSHGIGLTPDEKQLWVADAFNERIHVFDATVMPPKQIDSIKLREQPGWVTFSIDGQFAYPSTGDVISTATRKIVLSLKDEEGREVHSEKMVEIDFVGNAPIRAGDQFGLGHVTSR